MLELMMGISSIYGCMMGIGSIYGCMIELVMKLDVKLIV